MQQRTEDLTGVTAGSPSPPVDFKATLEHLLAGRHLAEEPAYALLARLASDALPEAMAGALLAALRAKGEHPDELRGFARAMRDLARTPELDISGALDIVGTGGDGSGSLNLSTGSALLAAACGVPVVKHGNRSVSSRTGSADVLEALGLPVPLDEHRAGDCLEATGFTFLFAPYYHPAMGALAPVRRALGVRTIFNLLGPLANPAGPPYHLIGAFSREAAELMAQALSGLPIARAFVVHGEPGWDEPTPVGPFSLFEVQPGSVHARQCDPLDFGLRRCNPRELAGGDAHHNAARLRAVLEARDQGGHCDALLLGAGLGLAVCGRAGDVREGIELARAAIDDGRAADLLEQLSAVPATEAA